ncbi:MAG: type II secretion system F family protein [Mobiluncus porci]|uniref:type II secretion system F family protein n=1 Tax=Mobiluncus porci TaxID=2652278 RepID=UPI0023F57C56|nr:type II secretion system F family protein [Mobiluncus porci]MDD7540753.1 type II secretion system F family protein [Mobiluncus porci]MDY5748315.1 type II secretion system F family protein [Mobiluncus porci]
MIERVWELMAELIPTLIAVIGAYLLVWTAPRRARSRDGWEKYWRNQQQKFLRWAAASETKLTLTRFLSISAAGGLAAGIALFLVTKLGVVAILGGIFASYLPYLSLNSKQAKLRASRGKHWPHLVDDLVSGVRAGLSLGETLLEVAAKVPPSMRAPFQRFVSDYRAIGNLDSSLALLKRELADPIGDRIIEALRLAAQVGGNDLVALLEDLGSMLRAEERTRAEILARQSWTVTGARLATAAPWIILAMLLFKGQTFEIYSTPTGSAILLTGAGISVVAYLLMLRLGRLDAVPRTMSE